jgi:hypothetical protein
MLALESQHDCTPRKAHSLSIRAYWTRDLVLIFGLRQMRLLPSLLAYYTLLECLSKCETILSARHSSIIAT